METLSIRIINPKAKNLLKDMEDLQLISVLNSKNEIKPKPSSYLRGSISKESGDALKVYVKELRKGWERNF
jgi:hypothetical protein